MPSRAQRTASPHPAGGKKAAGTTGTSASTPVSSTTEKKRKSTKGAATEEREENKDRDTPSSSSRSSTPYTPEQLEALLPKAKKDALKKKTSTSSTRGMPTNKGLGGGNKGWMTFLTTTIFFFTVAATGAVGVAVFVGGEELSVANVIQNVGTFAGGTDPRLQCACLPQRARVTGVGEVNLFTYLEFLRQKSGNSPKVQGYNATCHRKACSKEQFVDHYLGALGYSEDASTRKSCVPMLYIPSTELSSLSTVVKRIEDELPAGDCGSLIVVDLHGLNPQTQVGSKPIQQVFGSFKGLLEARMMQGRTLLNGPTVFVTLGEMYGQDRVKSMLATLEVA